MNKPLQKAYQTLFWLAISLWGPCAVRAQSPLLTEDFAAAPLSYTLTGQGWTAHSSGGTNSIQATEPGLTYQGLPTVGGSATLTTSGEDINRTFTQQTSGSVYASFLVNVTSAQSGDYFFHLGPSPIGTSFYGRVYVKNVTGGIQFGVTKSNETPPTYAPAIYSTGITYLLVVKYTFNPAATDDRVDLFIEPALAQAEPTVTATASTTTADATNIGSVALRQGGTAAAAAVRVDYIRVGTSWASVTSLPSAAASLLVNPTTLTGLIATAGSASDIKQFSITGSNLDTGPVSVSATTGIELSTDGSAFAGAPLSLSPASGSLSQVVYARITNTVAAGAFSGTITTTSNSTLTAAVTLSGQVNPVNNPTLAATPTTLSGFSTLQGTASTLQSYTLAGTFLGAPISVSAPAGVAVSNSTTEGSFATTATVPAEGGVVYVRLTGATIGQVSGIITNSSGSLSANVAVSGTVLDASPVTSAAVVISQIYGGGGNSGATYKNDFIELFNRSTSPVDLSDWSVQYASSTGTSWQVTRLSGTIPPGGYYLIQEGAGAGGTADLPTPDATGSINLSGTTGKVALVNISSALSGTCATGATVVDFVGFGTATCFDGTGPAPAPSNTNAILRASNGCTDTNNNATDFATASPNPRNAASELNPCITGPTITASPKNLTGTAGLTYVEGAQPTSKPISISGTTLNTASGAITVTSSNPAITVSPISLPFSNSALAATPITVQLAAGTPVGTYTATLTLTGGGATLNVPVSGTVTGANTPSLVVSTASLSFSTTQGTPSAAQAFTLTAANSASDIVVTAPAGVEVSQTETSGYNSTLILAATTTSATLYARLTGATAGQINGTITSIAGSLTASVTVVGTVGSNTPYTPISIARTGINQTFTIAGRVTVTNQLGSRQIYIQDATGGIAVYSGPSGTDLSTLVQLGDSVQTRGPVTVFNGYLELTGTNNFTVVSGVTQRVPDPTLITLDQLSSYQGQLVRVTDASITPVASTFTGNTNYTITANGQTGVLRINANSPLAGAGQPANPVSVTGIAERFVSGATTAGTNSLQLQPRLLTDIPGATAAQDQICTIPGNTTLTTNQTLDIAAWNMEFFGADAGVITCPTKTLAYNDMGPVNEDLQQANAVTVLGKLNADIIAVEEISDINRFDATVKSLPGSYSYVCSTRFSYYFQNECDQVASGTPPTVFGPTSLAQKVCVIYNTETVTPILAETKPLLDGKYNYPSDNGWSSGRLPFLFVADATINGLTQRVHVVAIHAKSGSATADYTRRKQDIIDLKALLDADYPKANIIILGDFNDKLNGSIATGQVSSYQPFVQDASNYSALTLPLENLGCSTFNSSASFIDHMIVSDELNKGYVSNTALVLQPFSIPNYGNTTSDHNPIISRFDLTQLTAPVVASLSGSSTICAGGSATLTATVSGGVAPYTIVYTSGTASATVANYASGTAIPVTPSATTSYSLVSVTDASGKASASLSQTATVTVSATVPTPVIASVTAVQGSADVVLTASNCTGTLVWTGASSGSGNAITVSTATLGSFAYSIQCTVGNCVSQPASVTVTIVAIPNAAPTVASPIPNQTGKVNQPFSYTIPANTFADDAGVASLTYTAAGLPAGVLLLNGVISGTPTTAGVSSVTVTATDAGNLSASISFTLTVNPAGNSAPVATVIASQTATVGVAFSLIVPAFTDAETPDQLDYTVNGLPKGLKFDKKDRSISGTPTTAGSSTVTVTATDPGKLATSTYFVLTIKPNTAPTVVAAVVSTTVSVGQSYSLAVAPVFTDAETPTQLNYSVSNLPKGLKFDAKTNVISGSPTAIGLSTITLTAADPEKLSVSTSYSLTVKASSGRISGEENSLKLQINAYPNPVVSGSVSVKILNVADQPVKLRLIDLRGKVVDERPVTVSGNTHTERVELHSLPSGMFLLQVSTDTASQTITLIKE